jgi:hypothetical protein
VSRRRPMSRGFAALCRGATEPSSTNRGDEVVASSQAHRTDELRPGVARLGGSMLLTERS